ncbi:hypothetical protein A4G28_23630 [Mycobacterium ostraviense]|uniref:Fumarate lyase N-terminal domain-containing protein n=1 Tax=Mycobacterium ostraviense TaxID=2738409 RepID=A0A162E928_9MYCO|nr:hypothetical protein A4G28_23630 [Mycobacterium ostraviense]
MANLLWPGDQRAGDYLSDESLLRSMVAVESAWLGALAYAGLAPIDRAGADLWHLVGEHDCELLAVTAEDGGNPVIGLVSLLRDCALPAVAPWIHRGLTSQDVLDTSLMLGMRSVADHLITELAQQITTLSALARAHRATPMVARTLTQYAAPTTFGAKAAVWLNGVVDAYRRLGALATPAQFGGAVGTWSATMELASLLTATAEPTELAERVVRSATTSLGLQVRLPWHTTRTPVTAAGDDWSGAPTAGAGSPPTSSRWLAPRSPNSANPSADRAAVRFDQGQSAMGFRR